jgi:hypothetical protein
MRRSWNLSPVESRANSAKRDDLPPRKLIASLARQHAVALTAARPLYGDTKWKTLTEPWLADLHLDADLLLQPCTKLELALEETYERHLGTLIELAANHGFGAWAM